MSKMVTRSGLVLGLLGLMGFQRCSASSANQGKAADAVFKQLALKLERLQISGGPPPSESDNASDGSDTSNGVTTDEDELSGLLNLDVPGNEEKSENNVPVKVEHETVTHTLQSLKAFIQPNPKWTGYLLVHRELQN